MKRVALFGMPLCPLSEFCFCDTHSICYLTLYSLLHCKEGRGPGRVRRVSSEYISDLKVNCAQSSEVQKHAHNSPVPDAQYRETPCMFYIDIS